MADTEPTSSDLAAASFETAVSTAKFGKYNLGLFFLSILGGWTIPFEVTTMSYVFPEAQCDLDLNLQDKGFLNASVYLGMVLGGFLWGFLSDSFGRQKILVITYCSDAICGLVSSCAQTFEMLLVSKILGGFFVTGASTALTCYISEFHATKHRPIAQMVLAMILSSGIIMLPLLGWAILPADICIRFSDWFVIHSWNVYLLVCALPPLVSGAIFIFMPESPKYLMTAGRNEDALKIFKKIFSCNTGQPKEEYPVKGLVDETKQKADGTQNENIENKRTVWQALGAGCRQIKPVCLPPHLKHLILVTTMQSMHMLSIQTLRLWLPQIFQSISDYKHDHEGATSNLCEMLQMIHSTEQTNVTCQINHSSLVYVNTVTIASATIVGYIITAFIINRIERKLLLRVSSLVSGVFVILLYISQNIPTIVALSSVFFTMGNISLNLTISVAIDLFPTAQRSLALAVIMTLGRIAAMVGNVMFPILVKAGCAPPFVFIGSLMLMSSLLTTLLPKTDLKALE